MGRGHRGEDRGGGGGGDGRGDEGEGEGGGGGEGQQVSVLQKQKTFGEVLRTAELGTSDNWGGSTRADFQYKMEKHQLNYTFGRRYLKLLWRCSFWSFQSGEPPSQVAPNNVLCARHLILHTAMYWSIMVAVVGKVARFPRCLSIFRLCLAHQAFSGP